MIDELLVVKEYVDCYKSLREISKEFKKSNVFSSPIFPNSKSDKNFSLLHIIPSVYYNNGGRNLISYLRY